MCTLIVYKNLLFSFFFYYFRLCRKLRASFDNFLKTWMKPQNLFFLLFFFSIIKTLWNHGDRNLWFFFLATQPTAGDCLKKKRRKIEEFFFISASTRGETAASNKSARYWRKRDFPFCHVVRVDGIRCVWYYMAKKKREIREPVITHRRNNIQNAG